MTSSPVVASHIRIVLSSEPDTMRVPSGENPTDSTDVGVSFQGTHDLFSSRRIPYSDRVV